MKKLEPLQQRLELYKNQQPWRESFPGHQHAAKGNSEKLSHVFRQRTEYIAAPANLSKLFPRPAAGPATAIQKSFSRSKKFREQAGIGVGFRRPALPATSNTTRARQDALRGTRGESQQNLIHRAKPVWANHHRRRAQGRNQIV